MRLAWWAAETPDAMAIVTPDGTGLRTFAELNAGSNRVVRSLRARGLDVGDAVALACRNRAEFAEVVDATHRAGFRLTPINWHLTADEAAYIVADCQAKAFVADAAVGPMAAGAAASAPGCTVRLSVGGEIEGFEPLGAATAVESGADIDDPTPGTTMLYTSGTTGRPKGVHRPHDPTADAPPVANIYGYDETGGDVHLCTGPLYHAAPMAFSLQIPLAFGATVVLMQEWDAALALRLIEEHGVTHTHMVATMFHRLLSLPASVRAAADTSTLRHVLHGAAPCPVPTKQALMDWLGPIVWEYYAATEGVGCFASPATWLERPGTVGRPTPADQVFVGADDGSPLPPSEVGLVYIKAPPTGRFTYFGDAAKTDGAYRGDHFTLGDVGYMDEDGYLFLTDRSADLIISGGVNIYPAEVDAVLLTHPAVGDAATIGVPDEEWGERVLSVVELQPDVDESPALEAELIAFCRERLAHFKCPRAVAFTDALPRQDNGKLYKRRLREQYAAPIS
ncbi:AMP-binding protein [Iamia sp. SCSIO 61187]|nr:AMP-binding protein [Iamia sp. SCSIO 61187]